MLQTWEEQEGNQLAFRQFLQDKKEGEGYTPYRQMTLWRRRFWWSLGLNAVLLVLFLKGCK